MGRVTLSVYLTDDQPATLILEDLTGHGGTRVSGPKTTPASKRVASFHVDQETLINTIKEA